MLVYIAEHGIELVMGSSLGAFITLTLTGVPRVAINPCCKPSVELPKIGATTELVATYAPFEEMIEHPEAPELMQAYFADSDGLLGDKYIECYQNCYDASHCHRIHSAHHLSEEGAKVIIDDMLNKATLPDRMRRIPQLTPPYRKQQMNQLYQKILKTYAEKKGRLMHGDMSVFKDAFERKLTERESEIIKMAYGIDVTKMTVKQIAESLEEDSMSISIGLYKATYKLGPLYSKLLELL